MSESTTLDRVSSLISPILRDLQLELYDLEFRGGTLRVTVDTPPNSEGGVNLESITLATRLISREFDHEDPVPGHYTLEVTSPGLERTLRTPAHFRRELGKTVALRLRDIGQAGERRVQGTLVAAEAATITVRLDDDLALSERVVEYDHIDRAKTVFVWGPAPKPGKNTEPKPVKGPAKTPRSTAPRSKAEAKTKAKTARSESKALSRAASFKAVSSKSGSGAGASQRSDSNPKSGATPAGRAAAAAPAITEEA
jgi:ribosome maturation factor RimP